MILFKLEHKQPILEERKTQTRRLGKKRWNIGAVHQARTKMLGKPFAFLRITDVRQEPLSAISDADAKREGYDSVAEFLKKFSEINWAGSGNPVYWTQPVWVVEFELDCELTRACNVLSVTAYQDGYEGRPT